LAEGQALIEAVELATDFEVALYTGTRPDNFVRWPRSGWISASVADLSVLIQAASVPPSVIDQAADQLESGVSEAAGLLADMGHTAPGALQKIARDLRQEDGMQTRRMAMTILANAFVFHGSLAGGPGGLEAVNSLDEIAGSPGGLTKSAVLAEWRKILEINYWPIFDIARRILEDIPPANSRPLIDRMAKTAEKLLENRLMRSHDLNGAVFQRLIADRKFLAAFYTTPASAALLIGLAITPQSLPGGGENWADADALRRLRIADFACGTGTLLCNAYQRIGQLHELAGGNAELLHPTMMANALVGCDVLPAAAHLTASMLSGSYPTVKYNHSSIMTVGYGVAADETVMLGSLDLLDPQGRIGSLAVTAKALGAVGAAVRDTWESIRHRTLDMVVMNPPFTRGTGHESAKIGVHNPMFAAFNATDEAQKKMSQVMQRLTRGTSAHGNAGEASYFLVLADRMLKPDGVLALVMPLSLVSGDAWAGSRKMLARDYTNLIVASIAGESDAEMSFSADTDMGECLVIGQKVDPTASLRAVRASKRATFVILNERPGSPMAGAITARRVRRLIDDNQIRKLEDGPLGGTAIYFGDDLVGHCIDAPLPGTGGWNVARIADLSLGQAAYQLANEGRIWLPSMPRSAAAKVPVTRVSEIGRIGPYHMDVQGKTATGGVRGPFSVTKFRPGSVPTYPVLWSHETEQQRTLSFDADEEGIPLKGKTRADRDVIAERVESVWASASHCHFNRDFRFNSQVTGMQFTPRRTIGGRAWPSILLRSKTQEIALVLWANTSLGLLLHWWHSNKQQAGRGSVGINALETLPVLDVTALTPAHLSIATALFESIKVKPLLPVNEIARDGTRIELDTRFANQILRLPAEICEPGGALDLLRRKMEAEPSIRGNKKPRLD
jgi:hypothetical protein